MKWNKRDGVRVLTRDRATAEEAIYDLDRKLRVRASQRRKLCV